jgi:hypothetical protein
MDKHTEKKYQLTVKGNVKMLTMMDSFTTVAIYSLISNGPNATKPELQEYVLEEREVKLTEYFDPNTYQLIEYINKLAKIYSRQHVCINNAGAIKGLLNMPEIKVKWEMLKRELMHVNPIAAFEVIRHKDRELNNPTEVVGNLENTHFMHLYLYAFTIKPDDAISKQQKLVRDRMGIGFSMPVVQMFTTEKNEDGHVVNAEAILDTTGRIDKNTITRITGQKELEIKHYTRGSFNHNRNGELIRAEMTVFEQLNDDYKSDLYMQLELI